ncbi:DUF2523 domain-containing protein [Salmonella enterica subsp. enterica serovar Kirkee]|uniref:DUF2523 domain-containing protein n=1 Tax=Salmonella enterica I TaxID=59201 RepID=A0A379UQT2_SALET|nr:DUF2523 domain-containing protein [Salmonella enterica subsp. enterica serovar Kirkee]SUG70244.1 Uncharacterised protein [Salmonella enterica subsp. enterica]EDT6360623.1 DUF2523 domain-containing protein [Salmonella enterica subsp. enterica serovar Kirkee]EEA7324757.1 DUF2523 domain-containing protein [Salmonella enterica subsp. enterica serovar Kirkee]SUG70261.1 Uncharacterised protein [Salmonella enterica subsp. enterica]
MFGIMTSVLYGVLGFLLRSVVVKFTVFFALYFIVQEFVPLILDMVNRQLPLLALISGIPDNLKYFFAVFKIIDGINIILSAFVTRFIIRRIPVIG